MNVLKKYFGLCLGVLIISGCRYQPKPATSITLSDIDFFYVSLRQNITEDAFTPPVAGRIYAYSFISAYEGLILGQKSNSLLPKLHAFAPLNITVDTDLYIPYIGALEAFSQVAQTAVYRGFITQQLVDSQMNAYIARYQIGGKFVSYSKNKGKELAHHITKRMATDGYAASRNKPFYNFSKTAADWEPTAPTYGNAIEPYWGQLKTFVIDTASQFELKMKLAFDSAKGSPFYKANEEVYKIFPRGQAPDSGKLFLAHFWDCNPVVNEIAGHAMEVRKQNTPGGHWLGIARIHFKLNNTPPLEAMRCYAILACGISDAFMVCWYQKYHYHSIRPETYINRYIDSRWRPVLECPLFPEFPSGHSSISASSAGILRHMFKDDKPYLDSTNAYINMPTREFNSMSEAADSATMSRFYGGIHYRFSVEQGVSIGDSVADFVARRFDLSPR